MLDEFSAIICRNPTPCPDFRLEKVRLSRRPKVNELKVRMVVTGLCHTDIFMAARPAGYPRVVGHEGAGIVEEIGPGVQEVAAGDPVLLSFDYCEQCDLCTGGQPSYCLSWSELNMVGEQGIFETAEKGEKVNGDTNGNTERSISNNNLFLVIFLQNLFLDLNLGKRSDEMDTSSYLIERRWILFTFAEY